MTNGPEARDIAGAYLQQMTSADLLAFVTEVRTPGGPVQEPAPTEPEYEHFFPTQTESEARPQ